MGQHDKYGKTLIQELAGNRYNAHGHEVTINYGAGRGARIDGVVDNQIAIEIESRVSKQIRGALLDLFLHPLQKKLLIVMPAHVNNPNVCAEQCRNILKRLSVNEDDFRVIILKGTGNKQEPEKDKKIILKALNDLGFKK